MVIYTLSLHDALPISDLYFGKVRGVVFVVNFTENLFQNIFQGNNPRGSAELIHHQYNTFVFLGEGLQQDRKSTRLNSSHVRISYAVFCLKTKNYNAVK